jgi:hypothetical protein
LAILEKRHDIVASERRVLVEFSVSPTCETFLGGNPKSAVAGDKQPQDIHAGESLTGWRLPRDSADAIEAIQARLGAEPQIAVGRLRNRRDRASGKAVANLPRRVCVLANVQRRIQRHRAAGAEQNGARQEKEFGSGPSPKGLRVNE